jgi:dienelactone hydrolase
MKAKQVLHWFWPLVLMLITIAGCTGNEKQSLKNYDPLVKEIKRLWKEVRFSGVPETYPAPGLTSEKVTGVFFKGLPFRGKETRVFAWYGFPQGESGKKVPAMVLVHGGEATASADWVRLWNRKGFAALALDNNGNIPVGESSRKRHDFAGPGDEGGFHRVDEDIREQWNFHAVANILLAHSLLRSFPQVDRERTGIIGVSWGGYLACIVSGIDPRFKCAIFVYGCGCFDVQSKWANKLKYKGEQGRKWLHIWDASVYLPETRIPMLWVSGARDPFFPLPALQKSYRLPAARRQQTLCIRVGMQHGSDHSRKPQEIYAFAQYILKGESALTKILDHSRENNIARVSFTSPVPLKQAKLNYTTDSGQWHKRNWKALVIKQVSGRNMFRAQIPADTTAYYFNLFDERGLLVSSPHVERETH